MTPMTATPIPAGPVTTRAKVRPVAERVYAGGFAGGEWLVSVRDEALGQWRRLYISPEHHRPDFALGHLGSDPARLAYALLADAAGPKHALRHFRCFLADFVTRWGAHGFSITRTEIRVWLGQGEHHD